MSTEPTDFASAAADPSAAAAEPVDPAEGLVEEVADEPGDDRRNSTVEELIADLERVTAERDQYLDQLRRNQAEFENAKRRLLRDAADAASRAQEAFAEKLLPVLDACDSAIGHGASEVEPIFAALLGTLEKEGLGRVPGAGEPFDPNVHEAVFHEEAVDGDEGTVVSEVLRPGYTWKERTLRPAMVKVRG